MARGRRSVGLDAAIVIVAHDRWFLESVGTAVLELEAGRSRFFPGTWAQWRREQAAREMALGKAIDKQQAEIERMERFVERFRYKASKAKQAQSRVKKLDKMERIERDPRDTREGLELRVQEAGALGRASSSSWSRRRLEVARPPRLLHDAELWLERGEHVSLVGANGTGKTTLIKALAGAGRSTPGACATATTSRSATCQPARRGARVGRRAHRPRGRDQATGLTPNKARALLGAFMFSGEEAEKPLDGLSGGERRRLSLAILVHSGANVLILDEPTNHLDLESREALEDALRAFAGALLLVSHDRALLDAVGTRTVAVERGSLRSYVGGWAEYSRVREERKAARRGPRRARGHRAAAAQDGAGQRRGQGREGAEAASPPAPRRTRSASDARLEQAVEDAEAALARVEEDLADPAAWATKYESAKSTARHTAAKRAVEDAYTALEAHMEKTGT